MRCEGDDVDGGNVGNGDDGDDDDGNVGNGDDDDSDYGGGDSTYPKRKRVCVIIEIWAIEMSRQEFFCKVFSAETVEDELRRKLEISSKSLSYKSAF